MKYFSMFSGIGGFELGIQRAFDNRPDIRNGAESIPEDNTDTSQSQVWSECVGYSEIDKYAIKVYERHFEHDNYGDATKINPKELPDFDLLVGGFPCQAFSIAGKRAGFNDTRGTLFFDIARILAEKRPRHLVLENVKGLLSHDGGKTFQTILGVLSDLGYRVEWQVLNSKDFGVPQNRERIYIVGHLRGECGRQIFPITTENTDDTRHVQREVSRTIEASYYKGVSPNGHQGKSRQLVAERIPLRFLNRNQKNIDGEYSYTVDSSQTSGVKVDAKIRRLTPKECERLQGFPDDWTAGESDTQRYKMCGNAVTVNVVEAVISQLFKSR